MVKPSSSSASRTALVIGGGGALGSAVVERLLASGRFGRLQVLVTQGFRATVSGLEPRVVESFDGEAPATAAAHTAMLIFDRARHANGREDAFLRPQPEQLPQIAAWLHRQGVLHLIIVMPHDPFGLPDALKRGLANLDEHSVAALGFQHVVLMRSAQAATAPRADRWLQRLADGALAQLRFMLPAAEQPVRLRKVAALAVEVALQLPQHPAGTRVLPHELVWQAAQRADGASLVHAWLAGTAGELEPDTRGAIRRM